MSSVGRMCCFFDIEIQETHITWGVPLTDLFPKHLRPHRTGKEPFSGKSERLFDKILWNPFSIRVVEVSRMKFQSKMHSFLTNKTLMDFERLFYLEIRYFYFTSWHAWKILRSAEKMDELRMFETFLLEELKRKNSTKNGREQDK